MRSLLRLAFSAFVASALFTFAVGQAGCECNEDLDRINCDFTVRPSGPDQPIEFGEVEVGDERARAIVIENVGNVRLSEFTINFAERNNTHYRLSLPDDFAVETNTSETVQVIFAPLAESSNLGSSFSVTHAPIGGDSGEGCPAFQVTLDGASFERVVIPDGGTPDGGDGDGDGDGDGGVSDGGDGDGDDAGMVIVDAGPITPPDAGFDPDDNLEFQARGALQAARSHFAAVALSDGTILVVGGYGEGGQAIDSVERFDPATGISTVVGHTAVPRAEPGAVELPSGRVAIVGGVTSASGGLANNTIEVWDPTEPDEALSVTCVQGQGDCLIDDIDQGNGLLPVGRLSPLVTAAAIPVGADAGPAPTEEVFVVALGRTLDDMGNEVLATGGSLVDLTNPVAQVDPLPGADGMPGRTGETRVIGQDGSVVVVGGQSALGPLLDAWRLDIGSPVFEEILGPAFTARIGGAGAVLADGDVLLAGGVDALGAPWTGVVRLIDPFGTPSVEDVEGVTLPARVGGDLVALGGDLLLYAGGLAASPAGLTADESVVPQTTGDLLVPFLADGFLRLSPENGLATPRYGHRTLAVGPERDTVVFLGGTNTVPRRTPHPAAERFVLAENRFEVWGLMGPGTAWEQMANGGEGALITAGGTDPHTQAVSTRVRVYDLNDDSYVDAPALAEARRDHSLTRLSDNGAYLVAGGRDPSGQVLATASIYVPLNPQGYDEPLPVTLQRARAGHTATFLDDGRVLLCGGVGTAGEPLDTCEVFTPPPELQNPMTYEDARFDLAAGRLGTGRVGHSATLLDSGEVLLLGGGNLEQAGVAADLFDPTDDSLDATGTPTVARRHHAAVLLGNGRVLIVGGEVYLGGPAATGSAEVYERQNQIFVPVGEMSLGRIGPGLIPFADGSVLVVGGARFDDEDFPTRAIRLSERYVPDAFGIGDFEDFDLPLTYGRADVAAATVFGRGVGAGGTSRDGRLFTGTERRTPQYFVDRLVDLDAN